MAKVKRKPKPKRKLPPNERWQLVNGKWTIVGTIKRKGKPPVGYPTTPDKK